MIVTGLSRGAELVTSTSPPHVVVPYEHTGNVRWLIEELAEIRLALADPDVQPPEMTEVGLLIHCVPLEV